MSRIFNLVLLGHGGSGKSSLISSCAYKAKLYGKYCTSELSDTEEEEKAKGGTLFAKVLPVEYRGDKFNFIDTPGLFDMYGEILSGLSAADYALLVVNAVNGIEVGVEKSWIALDEVRQIPTIILLNQMDKEGVSFSKRYEELRELHPRVIPIIIPIGEGPELKGVIDIYHKRAWELTDTDKKPVDIPSELMDEVEAYREKLVECAAEADEELLNKYLEEMELSDEEFARGFRLALLERNVIPLVAVSAQRPGTVSVMMDVLRDILTPADELEFDVLRAEEVVKLKPSDDVLVARAFKTVIDPYIGRITYVRMFSGKLVPDMPIYCPEVDESERVPQLARITLKGMEPTKEVSKGDIAAIYKLEYVLTGHTITTKDSGYKLPEVPYPEPTLERALEPKTKADEDKLSSAINKTALEDRTFKAYRDNEVKQFVIATLGDQHLDVILSKLRTRYKVNVELKPRKVPYRETIKSKATAVGKYIKQSGGRGQYGVCHIEIEPLPRGEGFKFIDKIVGGVIPKNFIPSVEKGVLKAMEEGVLAGYKVIDVQVTLFDGKYHEVDSSDLAFQIAGSMAFKDAMAKANPVLLEPIVEVEVLVPDSFMGDIIGLLNSKRARVMGMSASKRKGWQVIKALAPLAEMLDFTIELKSITQGKGSFTMKFSHYEEAPPNVSQQVIAMRKREMSSVS